jgi:carbamoyl-phosphate synthase large subunit
MVLGCGAYRIGSSVEFDWCAVSCIRTLRKLGHRSVMVNYNPETVSTDYDECDTLFFEEISLERVLDIYECEAATGVVVSVGGQIPNNLALPLEANGVNVLGTKPSSIDKAEDRNKFSSILDNIGVDQPEWRELRSTAEATQFCQRVGYPCLIRPSYVLSGAAMKVVFSDADLEKFLQVACDVSPDHPVVISKFVEGAKEIEVDAVAKEGVVLNFAIAEHVENAGVHSGDATLVLPAQKLYIETVRRVKVIMRQIAKELTISGPFNLQLLSKDNDVKVIEANVRASRTFPFVSKTLKMDFIELATRVMVGAAAHPKPIKLLDLEYVAIKAPMFSFTRLLGADPVLGVEMASTGEVATFGEDKYEAILTSMVSAGFKVPRKAIFLCIGPLNAKLEFLPCARALADIGLTLYCSQGTYDFYTQSGVTNVHLLHKPTSHKKPAVEEYLSTGQIDLVINVRDSHADTGSVTDGYLIRRKAVDFSVCLLTDIKLAVLVTQALARRKEPSIKSWDQFGS